MRPLDWIVLVTALVSIVAYGLYRSRGSNTVDRYLLAGRSMPWYAMALSIMATQASAITFISTTGQSYVDGMRFVQFYFGLPLAMVVICATVVPIFHHAKVYTAYEYLENRFDAKTRALASVIFLCQRGLSAGLTIYAPALVLSVILGWPERMTTSLMGATVVTYTVLGGIKAVTWSDVQQMCVIFVGLVIALVTTIVLLPASGLLRRRRFPGGRGGPVECRDHPLRLERSLQHLERPDRRHVPLPLLFRLRPVAGAALPDRQLRRPEPPEPAVQRRGQNPHAVLHPVHRGDGVRVLPVRAAAHAVPARRTVAHRAQLAAYPPVAAQYIPARFDRRRQAALALVEAHHDGDPPAEDASTHRLSRRTTQLDGARAQASKLVERTGGEKGFNDTNYIFLSFVTRFLPVGLVGLVIAVIFAATMSASSGEINSLATVTIVDLYKRHFRRGPSDHHYLTASRWATLFWGVYAVMFAGWARRLGSLIVAVNKVGSLFYGSLLGCFVLAFAFPACAARRVSRHAGGRSGHLRHGLVHRCLLALVQRDRLRGGGGRRPA